MTLYDTVISNLKGVIGSRRDGVQMCNLDAEYESMAGERFPLRKLGYDTLYDFLKSHTELFRLQGVGKYCRVVNVVGRGESDTTLELINLIQNTQPKNKNQCFQPKYQPLYHQGQNPRFQMNYQINFNSSNPPLRFSHSNNFDRSFSYPFTTGFPLPIVGTETNIKYSGFHNPNTEVVCNNVEEKNKRSSLMVPMQCLMKSKIIGEKANVLVISDDEETVLVVKPEVATQTLNKEVKTVNRLFFNFKALELVNTLIDVIVEFKQIKYNDIIQMKISGDLYYFFRLLTGFTIDPALFSDYVLSSIESPKIQYIYKDLIYLNPSKSHCFFNIKSTYKTKTRLPEFEFDYGKEYIIEIVKIFQENLIAFKISNKLNSNIDWKKSVTSEQTKEIIENQHFWSWVPGSLCLVRLPYNVVKKFNVASVERAIIISTSVAVLNDDELLNSQRYLIHNTSFYLIDHLKEVENLLSCSSSYQEVKLNAKDKNNTDLTYVCNMSVSAMNTPSKIQFTRLENFKDISPTFLDEDKQLKPKSMIILKNMKKMSIVFHFQSLHSSFSQIYANTEKPPEIFLEEKDSLKNVVEVCYNGSEKNNEKVDYSDIILISDDEDEVSSKQITASTPAKNTNILSSNNEYQNYIRPHKINFKPMIFQNSNSIIAPVSSYLEKVVNSPAIVDSSILKVVESVNTSRTNDQTKLKNMTKFSQPFYSEKIAHKIASTKASIVDSVISGINESRGNQPFKESYVGTESVTSNMQPFTIKNSFKFSMPQPSLVSKSSPFNESFLINQNSENSSNINNILPKGSSFTENLLNVSSIKTKVEENQKTGFDSALTHHEKREVVQESSINNVQTLSMKNSLSFPVSKASFNTQSYRFNESFAINHTSSNSVNTNNMFFKQDSKLLKESQLYTNYKSEENHINGFSYTTNSKTKDNETISIVSYSESEEDHESVRVNNEEAGHIQCHTAKNDIYLSSSVISYLENNLNPYRKCLRPLTTDMTNTFSGKIVKVLHIQTGSAVLMIYDSIKLIKRDIKMSYLKKQILQKVGKVLVGDFYIWRKRSYLPDIDDFILVEILQLVSDMTVLINNVHQGLLAVVNTTELFCLPEDKNGDIYGNIHSLLGPSIGAFDLHMFPDWFTPDESIDYSKNLFTAYFLDDGKLVLEYFEEPCRFLNIEMVAFIEKSLTINHCNVKSSQFIEMLSKNLLQCRLHVGNILEMLACEDTSFADFSISKALRAVTVDDKRDIWFASVLAKNNNDYDKISPHNFIDDQFCIDRVIYDDRRNTLRLMEHQNVYVDLPVNFEGLYKFDKAEVQGSLKGNEEFYTRYMLAGASDIPDLKYLHNKLIFDIRAF